MKIFTPRNPASLSLSGSATKSPANWPQEQIHTTAGMPVTTIHSADGDITVASGTKRVKGGQGHHGAGGTHRVVDTTITADPSGGVVVNHNGSVRESNGLETIHIDPSNGVIALHQGRVGAKDIRVDNKTHIVSERNKAGKWRPVGLAKRDGVTELHLQNPAQTGGQRATRFRDSRVLIESHDGTVTKVALQLGNQSRPISVPTHFSPNESVSTGKYNAERKHHQVIGEKIMYNDKLRDGQIAEFPEGGWVGNFAPLNE